MYYRRKVLLNLLDQLGGKAQKLQLQKLLFLFCQSQAQPVFSFLPYRYGAFSFQANADLSTLGKYGWVSESDDRWHLAEPLTSKEQLRDKDEDLLKDILQSFGKHSNDALIAYTYKHFPFYALNSQVRDKYLTEAELEKAYAQVTTYDQPRLFTIGYQGKSLEGYINQLIYHEVKVLCDVRKNAFSMKYGFSKRQLHTACKGVGIQYVHLPSLGIASAKRKDLKNQSDYDELFEAYKKDVLPLQTDDEIAIMEMLSKYGNVALTCFEADSCQCHRRPLAEYIQSFPEFEYTTQHL